MRSKYLAGVLVGALTLGGAIAAWAVPASQTTLDATFKPGSTKGGTKAKPQRQALNVVLRSGTKSGEGQPATATSLNIVLPKTWRINSERWPKGKRCDIAEANQQKSESVCPKGSRVGGGKSTAKGGDGSITQNLEVDAYVLENGDLGFFLKDLPPKTTDVDQMIQGVTSNNRLSVKIPTNLQSVAGVEVGLTLLTFKLSGTTKTKGKTIAVVESRGCPKGRSWKFTETSIYKGGGKNSDSDTRKCRK